MEHSALNRDEASLAVIALRNALGQTQQSFAVQYLNSAVTTVARYETSHPPRGDVLLRLAQIAEQSAGGRAPDEALPLLKLCSTFRRLYLDEVLEKLGFRLVITEMDPEKAAAYLVMKLTGQEQVKLAYSFIQVADCLLSPDQESKKAAQDALTALSKAGSFCSGETE